MSTHKRNRKGEHSNNEHEGKARKEKNGTYHFLCARISVYNIIRIRRDNDDGRGEEYEAHLWLSYTYNESVTHVF